MGNSSSDQPPPPPPPALLSQPWRSVLKGNDWTQETLNDLKKKITTHEILAENEMEYFNILLVGQISAGKSSFFNTVESVFYDYVRHRALAGSTEGSLTKKYKVYEIKANDNDNQPIKFRFCDSMGLKGGRAGLSVSDIGKIMDGRMNHGADLSGGVDEQKPGYNQSPTINDRIHCVAFTMDASSMAMMDDKIVEKIKDIRKEANDRDMNPMVILTKIDDFCKETKENPRNAFSSRAIQEKVEEVSDTFGIVESMVHPVQNYSHQIDKVLGIDILMAVLLQQILRSSEEFIDNLKN